MILRLIGPEDEFTVDYWMENEAPSVVYNDKRVWVLAANSTPGEGVYRYYEQSRGRWIPDTFMKKVDKSAKAEN